MGIQFLKTIFIFLTGGISTFIICKFSLQLNFPPFFFSLFHVLIYVNLIYLTLSIPKVVFSGFSKNILHYTFGAIFPILILYKNNNGLFYFKDVQFFRNDIIVFILYAIIYSLADSATLNRKGIKRFFSLKSSLGLFFIVYLLFRIIQQILLSMETPNEERSLIIGGLEIHHFVTGYVIVYIGIILKEIIDRKYYNFFVDLLILLGIGNIIDQIGYIHFISLNDDNYFSVFSFVSPIIFISFFLIFTTKYGQNFNK